MGLRCGYKWFLIMRKFIFILFLASSFFSNAQIAFRSAAGSNNGGGGTSIIMTMPSGVQNGDVLVMSITLNQSFPINSITGWTNIYSNSAFSLWYKIASSEPSTYTVNINDGLSSDKAAGTIIAISGGEFVANNSTWTNTQQNASSTTIQAPTLGTFATTNGIDIFFGGTRTGTTAAAPTTYILAAQSASTGGGAASRSTSGVSYKILSSVTTVGSLVATYGAAAINAGHHIFIKERNRGKFFLILNQ